MSVGAPEIDLRGLQRRMDDLQIGGTFTLSISDYRRMFGRDERASGRLSLFARCHGCRVEGTWKSITFQKTSRPNG
jgi:hypothetical protein